MHILFVLLDENFNFCFAIIGVFITKGKAVLLPNGIRSFIIFVKRNIYIANILTFNECSTMNSADIQDYRENRRGELCFSDYIMLLTENILQVEFSIFTLDLYKTT